MDGWTNKRKSPCVLQDIVPFRAAAQKRKKIVAKALYDASSQGATYNLTIVSLKFKFALK